MTAKLSPEAPCADCDAPAVRMSAPEYSAGVDATPKMRCERHARPEEIDNGSGKTLSADVDEVLAENGGNVGRAMAAVAEQIKAATDPGNITELAKIRAALPQRYVPGPIVTALLAEMADLIEKGEGGNMAARRLLRLAIATDSGMTQIAAARWMVNRLAMMAHPTEPCDKCGRTGEHAGNCGYAVDALVYSQEILWCGCPDLDDPEQNHAEGCKGNLDMLND